MDKNNRKPGALGYMYEKEIDAGTLDPNTMSQGQYMNRGYDGPSERSVGTYEPTSFLDKVKQASASIFGANKPVEQEYQPPVFKNMSEAYNAGTNMLDAFYKDPQSIDPRYVNDTLNAMEGVGLDATKFRQVLQPNQKNAVVFNPKP